MSKMEKLKYPPCNVNPMTEQPYTRHKWVIVPEAKAITKRTRKGTLAFYKVACSRCGINDPRPPAY
jgi:hypothetical protein